MSKLKPSSVYWPSFPPGPAACSQTVTSWPVVADATKQLQASGVVGEIKDVEMSANGKAARLPFSIKGARDKAVDKVAPIETATAAIVRQHGGSRHPLDALDGTVGVGRSALPVEDALDGVQIGGAAATQAIAFGSLVSGALGTGAITYVPADVDYYTAQYLNPAGESGVHASYGGFLRDRPAVRAAADRQAVATGASGGDEMVGGGVEVVEHALLVRAHARLVPRLAVLDPAAQPGHGVQAAGQGERGHRHGRVGGEPHDAAAAVDLDRVLRAHGGAGRLGFGLWRCGPGHRH